jgi:hypothetical protein
MILDEQPTAGVSETTFLSEQALCEDWNRPEEDEAWSHLQPKSDEDSWPAHRAASCAGGSTPSR